MGVFGGARKSSFAGFLVLPDFMQQRDWRKILVSLLVELGLDENCAVHTSAVGSVSMLKFQLPGCFLSPPLSLLSGGAQVR